MTVKAEKTEWLCRNICNQRNYLLTPTENAFVVTKPSGITISLLFVCAHCLWKTQSFLSALLSEVLLGIHYTCPQSTPHSIMVHLTQLGTTCQGQHSSHAQLRDSSAWTSLQAWDETHAREPRLRFPLSSAGPAGGHSLCTLQCHQTYCPVVAAITLLVEAFVQVLLGLLWVESIRTDQPKSCKLFTINW